MTHAEALALVEDTRRMLLRVTVGEALGYGALVLGLILGMVWLTMYGGKIRRRHHKAVRRYERV